MKITQRKKEIFMPKRNEKRSARNRNGARKILRARYDAKSHYTLFDVCPVRVDGKRAPAVRRGTLEGASWKEVDNMLNRAAQIFACREIEVKRFGDARSGYASIEILKVKEEHHHV
jgi:hypothetical protein